MPLHKDDPKTVGGYKLVDRLGSGGMGVVYWGRSRSGRDVAVKVVHAQYAEDRVFRARFRQEIESVRKVSGAFTAPVVDADPEAVRPWMATQYVPGSSLAERIRDHGALRGTQLRRLALGLVEALQDIHRAGVVHRDLKPANVLMAEDGPRVIDFGISRAAENHQTLTETGQMIGTPPFMSPEQFTDARTVGPASDVFSLAALLVYSATGRGPFDADSPYMTAFRVVHEPPGLDGVPPKLRAVLERCLVKDPAERPQLDVLAKEFAEALPESDPMDMDTATLTSAGLRTVEETYVGTGHASPAKRTRGGGPARRRVRPLLTAVCAVGALILGTGWYLAFGPGFPEDDPAEDPASVEDSRLVALPADWQPWRSTTFATAERGEINALVKEGGDAGEATCRRYENAVYCAGNNILPVRLDGRTGATVWRSALASSAEDADARQRRDIFQLLGVQDDTMLLQHSVFEGAKGVAASIVALDTESGEERWSRPRNSVSVDQILSGDLVMTPDVTGKLVTARSVRTGADRWTAELPSDDYCQFTTAGTRLYAHCFPDAESEDALLLELDKRDGSVLRRLNTPHASSLLGAVDGRLVFVVGGELGPARPQDLTFGAVWLLDPDTGKGTATKLTRTYDGSVRMAADTLWIAQANGKVAAVSPLTGKLLWQTGTSVEGSGQPTYDGATQTVYVASISGRVAALDPNDGTLLWESGAQADRTAEGDSTRSMVLPYGGALVVSTPDGTVFSLDPAAPEDEPASG
ncbi:serine/threonine-protein kinase [Streptomyces sp. S.PB5]|uniref:serine/threonine-protein kinase n=1 Tax=Streptomyces sp. S.PB5 TaxID=3020844 RepID=UPI0025AF3622|nr:serine/threonine-protein kinase [Streptomyces sp. S.PB5]MDN3020766.1 serine/threonine-protein kinase [Streptomyces sp. S.PB5]